MGTEKKNIFAKDFEKLHHAYLLEGDREEIFQHVRDFLKGELKLQIANNPDYTEMVFDSFGVEDARALRERAQFIPIRGTKKFFLISLNSMTHEAQNALLKLFEEPSLDTHFFITVPNASIFLPTLRSRLYYIYGARTETQNKSGDAFLKLSKPKRLAFIKELVDAISKEEKTREDAIRFLSELESTVHKRLFEKSRADWLLFGEELLKAKRDLYSRSPSVKLLLEHIALTAPVIG